MLILIFVQLARTCWARFQFFVLKACSKACYVMINLACFQQVFNFFTCFQLAASMEYTFEHVFNTISASCQQVGPIHQFSLDSFYYLWRHSIHVLSTRFMHFYYMFSATMKLQTSYLMFLSLSPGPSSSSRSCFKSYPTSNFKFHNSCGHASVDWGGARALSVLIFLILSFSSYLHIRRLQLALPFVTKFKIVCWSRFFGGPLDYIIHMIEIRTQAE